MSFIDDIGKFISGIPIVGNITDEIDRGAYQTLGKPLEWLGLVNGLDDWKSKSHLAGIIAATYGLGGWAAAPEAAGLDVGAGISASAAAEAAAAEAAAVGGEMAGFTGAPAFDLGATLTPTATALAEETAAAGSYGGLTGAESVIPEAASPLASNPALPDIPAASAVADVAPAATAGPGAAPGVEALPSAAGLSTGAETLTSADFGSGATKFMDSPLKWTGEAITGNPFKSLMALNALNSLNKADMMKGGNTAQQESYDKYLNAINPDEATKNAQLNVLKSNITEQGTLAQRRMDDTLAARGIRGKGKAAPAGDLSEAKRKAENAAYNQIFGKFNVPTTPGPVNYSPSVGNIAAGDATNVANQLLAMQLMRGR